MSPPPRPLALVAALGLALAPVPASAFVSSSGAAAVARAPVLRAATDDGNEVGDATRRAALAACGAVLLPSAARAKQVNTMDFSLPSSYDNLSDATADGIGELAKPLNPVKEAAKPPRKKKEKKPKPEKEVGGAGISMPSLSNPFAGGGGGGDSGDGGEKLSGREVRAASLFLTPHTVLQTNVAVSRLPLCAPPPQIAAAKKAARVEAREAEERAAADRAMAEARERDAKIREGREAKIAERAAARVAEEEAAAAAAADKKR